MEKNCKYKEEKRGQLEASAYLSQLAPLYVHHLKTLSLFMSSFCSLHSPLLGGQIPAKLTHTNTLPIWPHSSPKQPGRPRPLSVFGLFHRKWGLQCAGTSCLVFLRGARIKQERPNGMRRGWKRREEWNRVSFFASGR